jgi:hypothetical protein
MIFPGNPAIRSIRTGDFAPSHRWQHATHFYHNPLKMSSIMPQVE